MFSMLPKMFWMSIRILMLHFYNLYLFNYLCSSEVPGSNPDFEFSLYELFFPLCFNQLQYLYIFLTSNYVLNVISSFLMLH